MTTAPPRHRRPGTQRAATLGVPARWAILLLATILAFHRTVLRIIDEAQAGAGSGFVLVIPVFAAFAAWGLTRRRRDELPIHDRQTDRIVGVAVLVVALAVRALLTPRYREQYVIMHLDVLAMWLFVLGGCVVLFGLRGTSRYWPVWLVLLFTSPLILRLVVAGAGGSRFASGATVTVLAAVCIGIACGRTPRRGLAAAAATVLVGWTAAAVHLTLWPGARVDVVQIVPTVFAAAAVGAVFLAVTPDESRKARTCPVTPRDAAGALALVIPLALGIAVLPLPGRTGSPLVPGPASPGEPVLVVPAGWYETAIVDYDWQRRFYGRTATLHRQMLRATEPDPRWDELSRPRSVAVQTLTAANPALFQVNPVETSFDLSRARVGPKRFVDLGHGVEAQYFTVADDDLLLTWSLLSFTWTRGDTAQRVTLLTVDNHEHDAVFPAAEPNMASNLGRLLTVFLRGGHALTDTESEDKDVDLLTALGRELVAAQW
ncbi:archaeosortase/exosortase family protein [Rhodococcus sp. HM1]|uniref:archaeosortase/exosortase family protein n=1 Tax=Rhodococcus sp. HM1 TaxID=2937759 RepID=UPI00200A2B28|nr:archaeosortase/exosortase family protein [Rhodococcus sp. HM1]MCK8675564.1 archaeosortase/exosortase family protein [Rhodococcus sp. HM1]